MKKLAWIALGVLVAAGIGGAVWLGMKRLGADDDMYSRAMAAGMPLEPEQVWIDEPPTAEEDAGPLMVQAAEAFAALEIESEGIVLLALGTRAEADRARQELQQAKPVLDLIDEACKRPDARIVRDWALGPNLFLRELPVFKGICQLLTARAMLSIREGRFDAGVNDLERAYHFAYLVGREPNLIAMLVRISSEMIVQSGIRTAADQATTPEQIAKLRQVVEKGHQELSLFHHIRTEPTMSAAAARNPDNQTELKQISTATKTGEMADDPRLIRSGPPADKKMRALLNIALAKWMPLFELGDDAWDNAKAGPVLKQIAREAAADDSPLGKLAVLFVPSATSAVDAETRRNAAANGTLAYLDALQFKLEKGRLPKSLDELPSTYPDPFSGKPLLYRLEGKGFVIWSVDANGTDEGGHPTQSTPLLDYTITHPTQGN